MCAWIDVGGGGLHGLGGECVVEIGVEYVACGGWGWRGGGRNKRSDVGDSSLVLMHFIPRSRTMVGVVSLFRAGFYICDWFSEKGERKGGGRCCKGCIPCPLTLLTHFVALSKLHRCSFQRLLDPISR